MKKTLFFITIMCLFQNLLSQTLELDIENERRLVFLNPLAKTNQLHKLINNLIVL